MSIVGVDFIVFGGQLDIKFKEYSRGIKAIKNEFQGVFKARLVCLALYVTK